MIRLRRAIVIALGAARPGAHELEVDVDGERATAIAYPDLCGPVTVGDVVILNTTAVSLGVGHRRRALRGRGRGCRRSAATTLPAAS